MAWEGLRVGYVPYDASLRPPGDRRRFPGYARRCGLSFELADPGKAYDVVVLSERADLSVWAKYPHGRVVFDFIDSYLQVPPTPRNLARGVAKFAAGQSRHLTLSHWDALRRMCGRADVVVCATEEQRAVILPHCDDVRVILDFPEDLGPAKVDYRAHAPLRIVWEGLPQNVGTLRAIAPVLRRVGRETPLEVHLVTDPRFARWMGRFGWSDTAAAARRALGGAVAVRFHAWSEASLAVALRAGDLGVIPLPLDDPLYLGKPENKLLIFWRMGLPAVVSATPAYARAMRGAGLDMACTDLGQWEEHLRRYARDEAARRGAGERGKAFAEACHGEAARVRAWDELFARLLKE